MREGILGRIRQEARARQLTIWILKSDYPGRRIDGNEEGQEATE
jgi:hypothetical protein